MTLLMKVNDDAILCYPTAPSPTTTTVTITTTQGDCEDQGGCDDDGLTRQTIVYIVVASSLVFAVLQIALFSVSVFFCSATRCRKHVISDSSPDSPISLNAPSLTITISASDGLLSSSHPTILSQRTISDEIKRIKQLGQGSFGTVYLGK